MVRLKVYVEPKQELHLSYFNSTMVRLKDIPDKPHGLFNIFQFHYGSIKGWSFFSFFFQYFVFQFHYGSIKGMTDSHSINFCTQFQFHYGSIKGPFTDIGLVALGNFNSTMVRLKEEDPVCQFF